MAFVELKITTPLPDIVQVGTEYTIKGTVKIEGVIGAPPWVYAELQQKDWYKPDVLETIVYARGIPIPITGDFSIKWTPDAKGKIYNYAIIATPAPLAISGVKAIADIWTFPVLARTTPVLKTTTAETAPSAVTDVTIVGYDSTEAGKLVTVKVGDKLKVNVKYGYQGPGNFTGTLYAALYKKGLQGVDEVSGGTASKSIEITDASLDKVTTYDESIDVPIPNRGGETFGLYVKIGNVESALLDNVVQVLSTASVASDLTIVSYDGVAAGQVVTKKPGDKLDITVQFKYQGPGSWRETLYAALTHGTDEVSGGADSKAIEVTDPSMETPSTEQMTISIPIPNRSDGPFDLYAKLGNRESPLLSNVVQIQITGVPTSPTITKYTTPVNIGGNCRITVSFGYVGPSVTKKLYAAIGNWHEPILIIPGYFDEVIKGERTITIPNTPTQQTITEYVDVPVTSAISFGTYDVYAKLNGTETPHLLDVITVATTGGPTLTLDITGTTITFTFAGMATNATINVQVIEQVNQTTGAVTSETPVTSDANGGGTFKFTWTGATGTYWLKLTDASGNSVTQNFIVSVSVLPYLTVSPEIVKKGDTLAFAFAYFAKNAVITLRASSNTTSTVLVASVNSDAAGAGQYATTINLDPGVYVLDATDTTGNKADAQFTVYVTPIGIQITYPQYPKVAVGYGLQLGATATFADGTTKAVGGETAWLSWSSSDTSVATISNPGSVMGIKVGTTTITCIYTYPQATGYGTMTGTLTLTVVATQGEVSEPPVYAIDVTPHTPANLIQYYSQQFDAVLQYSQSSTIVYHDNLNVHWNSSNPSVATISSYGIVTGVAPGTTQISCIYGGTKSNVVTLTVIAPPSGAVTSVNGIVYDATKFTPLPGVTVTIGGVSVDTGSDGTWDMPNVSPGTPVKTFSATGYQSQTDKTFTILSGQGNDMGVMALFAITNNLITLTLSNLPSGVVLGGSPNSVWSINLYDTSGKEAAMVSITDATQKIYLPDDWVFPATFIFYMDKYIGTNEATEVANWQSYWGASSAHYTNYKFTGLGDVSLNVTTGNYTAPVTPAASASISPVSAPNTTPRTVTVSGFHANDSLFYKVVEGNPSLSDGGRADPNGSGTFTIYPNLMYDSTGYNFLRPGTYTLHIQSGWQITADVSFVITG